MGISNPIGQPTSARSLCVGIIDASGVSSIHDVAQRQSQQRSAAGFGAFEPHVEQAFLTIKGRMRIDDHAVMGRVLRISPGEHQGIASAGRLVFQDVDACSGQMSGCDRCRHGRGVDYGAPRSVHQIRAGWHRGDGLRVDQMMRLLGERAVRANDI